MTGCDRMQSLGRANIDGGSMSLNESIERRSFLKAVGVVGAALAVEGMAGATKHLPAAIRISRRPSSTMARASISGS